MVLRRNTQNVHEIVGVWVTVFLAALVELAEKVLLEAAVCAGEVGDGVGFLGGVEAVALGLLRGGEGVGEDPFAEAGEVAVVGWC